MERPLDLFVSSMLTTNVDDGHFDEGPPPLPGTEALETLLEGEVIVRWSSVVSFH